MLDAEFEEDVSDPLAVEAAADVDDEATEIVELGDPTVMVEPAEAVDGLLLADAVVMAVLDGALVPDVSVVSLVPVVLEVLAVLVVLVVRVVSVGELEVSTPVKVTVVGPI